MKIKTLSMLATLCAVLTISACGAKEPSTPTQAETQMSEQAAAESTEYELTDREKEVLPLGDIFDLKPYLENSGKVQDNTTDKDLFGIDINGTRFELGMTYDEVLALGFKPNDDEFMNKAPGSLAIMEIFSDNNGNSVELGFATDYENARAKTSVKEAGFLYLINPKGSFSIAGITENYTPAQIVECLGAPYQIEEGCYSDFTDAEIVYLNQEPNNKFLKFRLNLDSNSIYAVYLEGYRD